MTRAPAKQPELQREDRHSARALDEDRLARLRSCVREERMPGGDRGAPERRRLLVAQVLGAVNEAVLVQDDLVGEHAVKPAREHGA